MLQDVNHQLHHPQLRLQLRDVPGGGAEEELVVSVAAAAVVVGRDEEPQRLHPRPHRHVAARAGSPDLAVPAGLVDACRRRRRLSAGRRGGGRGRSPRRRR
jgi:hypothetical protein